MKKTWLQIISAALCCAVLGVGCYSVIDFSRVQSQAVTPAPGPGPETPGDDPTPPDNPGGNETPVALSNCEFLLINDTQAFLTRYATEAISVNDTDLPTSFSLGPVEECTYTVTDWHDEEFRMLLMERRLGYTDDEIRQLEEAYMLQTLELPYTYNYGVQTYTEGNDYEVIGIGGTGGSVFPACVTSITLPLSYKIIGYHALTLGVQYTELYAGGAIIVGAYNFLTKLDKITHNFNNVACLGNKNFGQTWMMLELFPKMNYYPPYDPTKDNWNTVSILSAQEDIQLLSDTWRYVHGTGLGSHDYDIIVPDALVDTYKAINSSWTVTPLSQAQST